MSGRPVKIAFVFSVNPDCSSQAVTPRIVQPPGHGTLTFVKTRDFAYFGGTNPRAVCNRQRVSGLRVEYRSQNGFLGEDGFVYDMFFPSGASNHVVGHVVVK